MNLDRSPNRKSTDKGYVLVITAISIVAMLGFSAIAIDLGWVYNMRRQDQSAADIAALGAAQDLGDDNATVLSAIALVNSSLDNPISAASFNTCAGEYPIVDAGVTYTASSTANCISFNKRRTRIRVRVPLQQTQATFGGVVGVDNYEHTAFAIAEAYSPILGGILPFGLTGGAGTYECIKAGASNVPSDRCSTHYSGNFGFVNIGVHGDESIPTTPDCSGQGANRVANNIAVGIDHQLSIYGDPSLVPAYFGGPHYGTRVIDTDTCGTPPHPNSLRTFTGNVPDETGRGLFSGSNFSDGGPARLRRTDPNLTWGQMTTVSGYQLDDNPLWEFIPLDIGGVSALAGKNVPRSCWRDQFVGDFGGMNIDNDQYMSALPDAVTAHLIAMPRAERTNRLMQRCFKHYVGESWDDNGAFNPAEPPPAPPLGCSGACTDPIFTRNSSTSDQPDLWDIQYTPRFGYVPEFTSGWPPGTSAPVDIKEFRAVYLQRLFAGNCNTQGCDSQFDPGVFYSDAKSSTKAAAITAFVFPDTILPGGLGSNNAPNEVGVNLFFRLVR